MSVSKPIKSAVKSAVKTERPLALHNAKQTKQPRTGKGATKGARGKGSSSGNPIDVDYEQYFQTRKDESASNKCLADAQVKKVEKETSLLDIEIKTKILASRQSLHADGVPEIEIDLLLPLPMSVPTASSSTY